MIASLLYASQCELGEGPLWHTLRKTCLWVDIEEKRIFEFSQNSQRLKVWNTDKRISALFQKPDGNLIVGFQGGIGEFSLRTGQLKQLIELEKDIISNRCNDGGCDIEGRVWIGTMEDNCKPGAGRLYCIENDLSIHIKLENLSIPNGIAWTSDQKHMYFIDSQSRQVKSFLFDSYTGHIEHEKIIIEIPEKLGMPDGMSIDEEGMLWIAHWGGFGVYRWNPLNGKLISKIHVPVPLVSSCSFAGDMFDQLIITTARKGLSKEELKQFPNSGDIFIASPGVKGMRLPYGQIGPN
jgi:sugar lactone lactonase YvrE